MNLKTLYLFCSVILLAGLTSISFAPTGAIVSKLQPEETSVIAAPAEHYTMNFDLYHNMLDLMRPPPNPANVYLDQLNFHEASVARARQFARLKQERLKTEKAAAASKAAPPPPAATGGRKATDTPPPPPPAAPPPPEDGKGRPAPAPQPGVPKPIMLGWQFISMNSTYFVQHPASQTGYNIYAPVVYFVIGSGDDIRIARHSQFSRGVLLKAAENGYRVWVTVQLFGASRAADLFADAKRQTAVIKDLVQKAVNDGAHGINVDFENMGLANRDGFTRFMQELYKEAQKKGLILSVDVNRPGTSSWSACYDHAALAKACDFMILMAYDQHTAGSPVAGPVASLSWTESAVKAVLDRGVPPQKLVLGVPFYSRNWVIETELSVEEDSVLVTGGTVNLRPDPSTENDPVGQATLNTLLPYWETVQGQEINGNPDWYAVHYNQGKAYLSATLGRIVKAGETLEGYERVSRSFALGLQHTLAMQNNYDPVKKTSFYETTSGKVTMTEVTMEDDNGLTLLTYRDKDGMLNKIWLENYDSLRRRYRLVEKYNLAGAAAWSLEWQSGVDSPWWHMLQ